MKEKVLLSCFMVFFMLIATLTPQTVIFAGNVLQEEIVSDEGNETDLSEAVITEEDHAIDESMPEENSVVENRSEESIKGYVSEDKSVIEDISEESSIAENLSESTADAEEAAEYILLDDGITSDERSAEEELFEEFSGDEQILGASRDELTDGQRKLAENIDHGDCTWVVGDGVTATLSYETVGAVISFHSDGGTLWPDWQDRVGPWSVSLGDGRTAVEIVNTVRVAEDSGVLYLPEDSTGLFRRKLYVRHYDLNGCDTSGVKNMSDMFEGCYFLESVEIGGFDTSNVTNMGCMFSSCESLTTIDLSGFDTSNVTGMYNMFSECESLKTIDLSGFDTSNVIGMSYMFSGCCSLEAIDLSRFDTSKVTSMLCMFRKCENLEELDISGFKTPKLTEVADEFDGGMFDQCYKLKKLDLNGFNTSKIEDMNCLFYDCRSLESLDLSSFDTSNVTDMSCMFKGCENLRSLNIQRFNTSRVENMFGMFDGCRRLEKLNVNGFKTTQVRFMDYMFRNCTRIRSLDLSSFRTPHLYHLVGMFEGCSNLEKVDISGFDTTRVYEAQDVFKGNDKLLTVKTPAKHDPNIHLNLVEPFYKGLYEAGYDYDGAIRFEYYMYDQNGKKYTELPALSRSITLTRRFTNLKTAKVRTKAEAYPCTGKGRKPEPIVTIGGKTLVKGRDYTIASYTNNIDPGRATITVKGKGNYNGSAKGTFILYDSNTEVVVYRLFNTRTGEHFYTKSDAERQSYIKAGWNAEGIAWISPKKSKEPVYRVSNPNNGGEHHYTKSAKEKDNLVSLGWRYEGIAWYSDTKKTIPVYRLYHPIQRTGNHHYTTSAYERDYISKNEGWRKEGIAWYVLR